VSESKRVSLWLILLVMLVIFFIVFDIHAQGAHDNCNGQSCNDGEIVVLESQVKRSIGIGVSGGDMDINDCLATHAVLWGIWQGTHINAMCEAAKMDRDGNYQGAAEMRCSSHKYKKVYGKGQECIDAVIRSAPPVLEVLVGQVPDTDEDNDARYAEQQEEIEFAREERASLVGQIDRLTQRLEQPPTQIDYGAARRAKSREAYEEALKGSEQ